MDRLKLIEKLETKFANMFRVTAVAVEAPRESARPNEKLARVRIVAMRFFTRENFTRDFAKKSLTMPTRGMERVRRFR